MTAKHKTVHGDDLLYRFFRDLFDSEPAQASQLAQHLIEATGIWFPVSLYGSWPVLLPWVVRDPSCRGSKAKGIPDQWSAPDAHGYLRDDNSMIKALPRSLSVHGPKGSHLNGARMGSEFVASHIWRVVHDRDLASRHPLLNSFVPNLVWLPSQIAKLSDQEGSPLQQTVQAMSWAIYREAPVAPHLNRVVDEAWTLIPAPVAATAVVPETLNWFSPTPAFIATRNARLASVIKALECLERNEPLTAKVISTRYTDGLPLLAGEARAALAAHLKRFVKHPDSGRSSEA